VRARRRAAAIAAAGLLAVVIATQSWTEVPRRLRFLGAFAPKDLAVRRLGGSGTAFDRRFFSFLENARRRIPPSTPVVAIGGTPVDEAHLFLASYCLAPLEVVYERNYWHHGPPHGCVIADYGAHPLSDAHVLERLPEGTLLGPMP
jgi:hypothetical protein